MINKTIVIFSLREPVEKVPGLFKLTTDEGVEFSTFQPDQYPLGEAIEVQYEAFKKPGSKFTQNRLKDKPASQAVVNKFRESAAAMNTPVATTTNSGTWQPPASKVPDPIMGQMPNEIKLLNARLDKIESLLKDIHGQIINPL